MPHPYMAFSIEECERLSLLPQKNTLIMATSQSSMDIFMLSVFSILLRSNPKKLEHLMVCINGADKRCGDPTLQDIKQNFLEELRNMKWNGRDMPLTVIRAWSRVGHSHSLEMAIPWVHTEFYTIIHDDVIILRKEWCEEAIENLNDPKAAICYFPPLLNGGVLKKIHNNKWFLDLPHLNSTFIVCRKSSLAKIGARWIGYHFEHEFNLYDRLNIKKFLDHHYELNNIESFPVIEKPYSGIGMDVGAWVYNNLLENKYEFIPMKKNTAIHLVGMSWHDDDTKEKTLTINKDEINSIYEEIKKNENYISLFEKYKNAKSNT